MKRLMTFLIAVALGTGCAHRACNSTTELPTKTVNAEGKPSEADAGVSIEHAIVIKGVKGEEDGVAAEYAWLRRHRPGYKLLLQSLVKDNGRAYDRLDIKTDKGEESIYFDITAFFGK